MLDVFCVCRMCTCMIVGVSLIGCTSERKVENPPDVLQLGGSGSEDLDSICHRRTFLICPEH